MSQEKTEFILIGDQIFNKAEISNISTKFKWIVVLLKKLEKVNIEFGSEEEAKDEFVKVKTRLSIA